MNYLILIKCFFIGVIAASGCGPVFILTFNKGALCGFFRGFVTALGAAIGDAFYFALGLMGALAVVGQLKGFVAWLDLIGGVVLISLGVYSLNRIRDVSSTNVPCTGNLFLTWAKAFGLTMVNPLVIFFFMAVSLQVLPDGVKGIAYYDIGLCIISMIGGSLAILTSVSFIASRLHAVISKKKLQIIAGLNGIGFLIFGFYLLFDLISKYLHISF
jgi:threonine/homoserine/homoserine lactone efflux protein